MPREVTAYRTPDGHIWVAEPILNFDGVPNGTFSVEPLEWFHLSSDPYYVKSHKAEAQVILKMTVEQMENAKREGIFVELSEDPRRLNQPIRINYSHERCVALRSTVKPRFGYVLVQGMEACPIMKTWLAAARERATR